MKIKRRMTWEDGMWVAYDKKTAVHADMIRRDLIGIATNAMLMELDSPREFTITVEAKK